MFINIIVVLEVSGFPWEDVDMDMLEYKCLNNV